MTAKKPSLLTLLLLMPFASISAVLFTPALPEIAKVLSVSDGQVQTAMTLFLLGYAFGNLLYGPIAKRFGRKPAIYLGVIIALFGFSLTLVAGKNHFLGLFFAGRFLSALGSSVGMKISFTIIADAFDQAQATKKLALATLAFAVAPGLAVGAGGVLTTYYGWASCFYALIAYSCLVFVLSLFLPETAPYLDKNALNFQNIKETYKRKLQNKKIVYSALILGCVTSIIYLFSTLAPFLGINRIGLTPEEYGFLNFIPPFGLIGGSLASHWLATRREKLAVIQLGGIIALLAISVMFIFFLLGKINLWTLFIPIPFILVGTSLVFNNASTFAMNHMQDKSNGSAIMSFLNMALATVAVLAAQSIHSPNPLLMPALFLFFACLLLFLQRRLKFSI
jgi:MFS family permease